MQTKTGATFKVTPVSLFKPKLAQCQATVIVAGSFIFLMVFTGRNEMLPYYF